MSLPDLPNYDPSTEVRVSWTMNEVRVSRYGLGQIMWGKISPLGFYHSFHYPKLTLLSRLRREQHRKLLKQFFLHILRRAILERDVC